MRRLIPSRRSKPLRRRKFVDRQALISYIKTLTRNELCVDKPDAVWDLGCCQVFFSIEA